MRDFNGELQLGANYVNFRTAIIRCAEVAMEWCAKAALFEEPAPSSLFVPFRRALAHSVHLDGCDPYEEGYPVDKDGMMTFGTTGVSTSDFARTMYQLFGFSSLPRTDVILSSDASAEPPGVPA